MYYNTLPTLIGMILYFRGLFAYRSLLILSWCLVAVGRLCFFDAPGTGDRDTTLFKHQEPNYSGRLTTRVLAPRHFR